MARKYQSLKAVQNLLQELQEAAAWRLKLKTHQRLRTSRERVV